MRCISFILFVSARKLQATRALHPRPLLLPLLRAHFGGLGNRSICSRCFFLPRILFSLLRRGILAIKLPQLFCLSAFGISEEDARLLSRQLDVVWLEGAGRPPLRYRVLHMPEPFHALVPSHLSSSAVFFCALFYISRPLHSLYLLSCRHYLFTTHFLFLFIPHSRPPIGTRDVSNRSPSPPSLLGLESRRFAGQMLTGILSAVATEAPS